MKSEKLVPMSDTLTGKPRELTGQSGKADKSGR